MKTADPVMRELLTVKEANAKRFSNLENYLAHLKKTRRKNHRGGIVAAPKRAGVGRA